MTDSTQTPSRAADLQTAVLHLAMRAAAGSEMRRALCDAASCYPAIGPASDAPQIDTHGGLSREAVSDMLRQINAAREDGDDPLRALRMMRNAIERVLDLFNGASE